MRKHWIAEEFERARERNAKLPDRYKPVVTVSRTTPRVIGRRVAW